MTRPATSARRRSKTMSLRVAAFVIALVIFAKALYDTAVNDESGLTTAEYVVLGAGVVVAAGVVGTLIAAFLKAKAGQIIGTP